MHSFLFMVLIINNNTVIIITVIKSLLFFAIPESIFTHKCNYLFYLNTEFSLGKNFDIARVLEVLPSEKYISISISIFNDLANE